MTRRTYHELPEKVTGYELAAFDIAVVKPKAATNLVSNPSVELATTGYTAVGGSIARIATKQRRGAYSLQVTPTSGLNDGVYYGTVSLTASRGYFKSVDFLGAAGVPYKLYFGSTAGAQLGAAYQFRGTGRWQRQWVFWQETSTTTRRLYITKDNHASTRPFYIDGLQCEADERTTYLDGSLKGFVRGQAAYYWTGAEHASPAVRVLATRSGGTEVKLRDLGFYVTALLGLGLNGVNNITLPNAFTGGSQYQRTVQTEYTFDIGGSFMADSLQQLMQQRRDLSAAVRPNAGIVQQPLLLKLQPLDDCGVANGEPVEIECLYRGGLEGQRDNYFQEPAVLTFTQYLPYFARLDGTVGAELDFADSFTSAYHAARLGGVWQALDSGFNNFVRAMVLDEARGRIYFVGAFTTADGGTVNRICYWDLATEAFVAMDAGTNGTVRDVALAANGDVWIAGDFTTVGSGAAATKGLARWNIATAAWTAFNESTSAFTRVSGVVIDSTGRIYIAGTFTGWEDAGTDYIAQSMDNGVNWSNVGTEPFSSTDHVTQHGQMAIDADDNLWTGGNDPAGSITTAALRKWDGAAWTTIASTDSVASSGVYALAFRPDGKLYIVGRFSTLGGISASNVAVYNGTTIEPLGAGLTNAIGASFGFTIAVADDGSAYVGGSFEFASGVAATDFAGWNGSAWFVPDVSLPAGFSINDVIFTPTNDLYVGSTSTGTATSSGQTTVTNPGSADSYPLIPLTGPGVVHSLLNVTTGDNLYFNLTLLAGETAVLDLTPGAIRFSSNFRANLLGTILPGSTLATWRLAPGDNVVSLLLTSTDANTVAKLQFQPAYASLDDVLYP